MTLYGFKSREVRDALISVGEGTAGLQDVPIPSREDFRPHKAKILTAVASSTITPAFRDDEEMELLAGQGEVCIVTRNKNQDPSTWSPRLDAQGDPLVVPVYNFSNRVYLVDQILEPGDVVQPETRLLRVTQDTYGSWYVLENDPRPFLVRANEDILFGSLGECAVKTGSLDSSVAAQNAPTIVGHNRFKKPKINEGDECLAVEAQTETDVGYLLLSCYSSGSDPIQTLACASAATDTYSRTLDAIFSARDQNDLNPDFNFFLRSGAPINFTANQTEYLYSLLQGKHTIKHQPDEPGFSYPTGDLRQSVWDEKGGVADCNRWDNFSVTMDVPVAIGSFTYRIHFNLYLALSGTYIMDAGMALYFVNVQTSNVDHAIFQEVTRETTSAPDMSLRWEIDQDANPGWDLTVVVNPNASDFGA